MSAQDMIERMTENMMEVYNEYNNMTKKYDLKFKSLQLRYYDDRI